ncbi:hypothetical protein GQ43DRAFT_441541 [Delitschia confertaspora ATCC 74209]|uniref:Uncharacterized protein n=1 Tax=Delitschia confertaspora ATCC 74209 TaxID=1513339 RepID=A0A9P4JLH9_9PLEO|nr:hypothetical protein GQ43DRAFT_441541 [Delitschia confertaspora ATCC 74209]
MGAIGTLFPLVVLFLIVGAVAYVGYQIYLYTNELADRGLNKMERKNVVLTKDGMKVGVKEIRNEEYTDRTQRAFVKAWTLAEEDKANAQRRPGKPSRSATK